MKIIYCLYQEFKDDPDNDDARLLGIYDMYEGATAAAKRFRENNTNLGRPSKLEIYENLIDRDGWPEGFFDANAGIPIGE